MSGYEFPDDRDCGVVWQVGDDFVSVREEAGGIEVKGVLVEDGEVLALSEPVGERVGEFGVEFNRYELGAPVYENAGESAFTGPISRTWSASASWAAATMRLATS